MADFNINAVSYLFDAREKKIRATVKSSCTRIGLLCLERISSNVAGNILKLNRRAGWRVDGTLKGEMIILKGEIVIWKVLNNKAIN